MLEELASMETRERSLLAGIIHDEPVQLIVAAAMRIDRLGLRSTDSDELEQISGLLETSIERLRRLIVALAPPDLAEGLGSALEIPVAGIFVGTETKISHHRTDAHPYQGAGQGNRVPDLPRGIGERP